MAAAPRILAFSACSGAATVSSLKDGREALLRRLGRNFADFEPVQQIQREPLAAGLLLVG
jgi:hypothetical protein